MSLSLPMEPAVPGNDGFEQGLKRQERANHCTVQLSSHSQLCPTLCDPMDCSTPRMCAEPNKTATPAGGDQHLGKEGSLAFFGISLFQLSFCVNKPAVYTALGTQCCVEGEACL